jgi:hypothetical protein
LQKEKAAKDSASDMHAKTDGLKNMRVAITYADVRHPAKSKKRFETVLVALLPEEKKSKPAKPINA